MLLLFITACLARLVQLYRTDLRSNAPRRAG